MSREMQGRGVSGVKARWGVSQKPGQLPEVGGPRALAGTAGERFRGSAVCPAPHAPPQANLSSKGTVYPSLCTQASHKAWHIVSAKQTSACEKPPSRENPGGRVLHEPRGPLPGCIFPVVLSLQRWPFPPQLTNFSVKCWL